ncbi:MAG: hypothetical protein K0S61_4051 [Anaerocolumna sp.]|jgi:glutaredoxin-related protein|nr:hypothetical protein [Anaerocolumna sp.]
MWGLFMFIFITVTLHTFYNWKTIPLLYVDSVNLTIITLESKSEGTYGKAVFQKIRKI